MENDKEIERNALKTLAYQARHAAKGLCRLCPKPRAKGDTRFCRACRLRERTRDRKRKKKPDTETNGRA